MVVVNWHVVQAIGVGIVVGAGALTPFLARSIDKLKNRPYKVHEHNRHNCPDCYAMFVAGRDRGRMEVAPQPPHPAQIAAIENLGNENRELKSKLNAYEKVFAALRIPVILKENNVV